MLSNPAKYVLRAVTRNSKRVRCNGKHQVRAFSIHEHHVRDLLREFQIPVADGAVVSDSSQIPAVARRLRSPWILKSQELSEGPEKGMFSRDGGRVVPSAQSVGEAAKVAEDMLVNCLVTEQTGPDEFLVNKLNMVKTMEFEDEFYLAMTVDRAKFAPVIILSKQGGVEIDSSIQSVADELHKFWFSIRTGIDDQVMKDIKKEMGFNESEIGTISDMLKKMFQIFVQKDVTLLEVNPLVRTKEGNFVCVDTKLTFDDAAERRQKDIFALRNKDHETVEEIEAAKHGLVYVKLDGNIGNVVNGAGLAMSTNDVVELYGGKSANFLDAGGQATEETMLAAFRIIIGDPRVKVILVNIYGGIIRCDMIAQSIIAAAAETGISDVPLVVRLQGTNSEAGLKLIAESGLGIYTASEFGAAAKKAVELAAAASRSS